MKVVESGAHYTTVTVDTAEAVKFSFPSTSLSVEAAGGDITVALTETAQAGDDETITVPDGESRMFIHHRMNVDTYYLTGSGTATLYASNMGDVNPFKAGKRGGDSGGDNTHYKGTTTTPLENGSTTNPIVIDGESYTAVFGDVVVYGYTEFVFDGTAWSEFGRPFDTVPTQDSTNAVTSDGVYRNTAGRKYYVDGVRKGEAFGNDNTEASGNDSHAEGYGTRATGPTCHAEGGYSIASGSNAHAEGHTTKATGPYTHSEGHVSTASGHTAHAEGEFTVASGAFSHAGGAHTIANKPSSTAIGKYNIADTDVTHLLIVGNGTAEDARSNILEVSETDMNVNGDIKINNVAIPTPYTTMPTITAGMLGKVAMYVGATGNGYIQGCFYVASTDGAAEPTYSWVRITGYRRVTLWENETETKRPATINLSASIYDFDAFSIEYEDIANGITYHFNTPVLLQLYPVGDAFLAMYVDSNNWAMYSIASATSLTLLNNAGSQHKLTKIIGIKY